MNRRVTAFTFRHHVSEVLKGSHNAQIAEAEKYVLCRSENTQLNHYTSEKVKKTKAVRAQDWYQSVFQSAEAGLAMQPEQQSKLLQRADKQYEQQQHRGK